MSRDWTPQEMYYADKYIQETQGRSMRDQRFYFVDTNGIKTPLQSDKEIEICKQYKELGFLYSNLFETYNSLKNHPKYRNKVLREIEYKLERYVVHNNSKGNDTDPIWLWYIGKLDSGFYYNKYNNELLHEYIIEEVNKLVKNGGKNV